MEQAEIKNQQWKLKDLRIEFQEYGDYKGKYVGKIKFDNDESEAFMFNLRPEMCQQYLALIKDELANAASNLATKVMQTLNLLPAPSAPNSLGTEIPHEEVPPENQTETLPF